MDGDAIVYEWTLNLTAVQLGEDVFAFEVPNIFPI